MTHALKWMVLITAGLLVSACVGKGKYDDALAELAATQQSLTQTEGYLEAARLQNASVSAELTATERRLGQSEREREDFRLALERTRTMLEEQSDEKELLLRRLAELEVIEAEERRRNEIYRSFIERFQRQIDAGQLQVVISRGRLVIQMPQDILFASGSAELGEEGSETLREIAAVLSTFEDRAFQVEGHTDDRPIATRQFPSNWELSSARSLAVVRLLIDGGMEPAKISGAAFGEFAPRATNEDAEGRALNRRIEIVMVPDLDLLSDSPVGTSAVN